jgi:hypothetical protein
VFGAAQSAQKHGCWNSLNAYLVLAWIARVQTLTLAADDFSLAVFQYFYADLLDQSDIPFSVNLPARPGSLGVQIQQDGAACPAEFPPQSLPSVLHRYDSPKVV